MAPPIMNPKQADAWLCATLRHGGVHFERAWIAGGRIWVVTAEESAALAVSTTFKRMAILADSETKPLGHQWITNARIGKGDLR